MAQCKFAPVSSHELGICFAWVPGTCRCIFPGCHLWPSPPGQSGAAWCVCEEDAPSYRAWETAGRMATGDADPQKPAAPWGTACSALEETTSGETGESWITEKQRRESIFVCNLMTQEDLDIYKLKYKNQIHLPSSASHIFKASSTTSPGPGLDTQNGVTFFHLYFL